MRFQSDKVGELVDALLTDHGGVHVGEEQLLLAMRGGLDDDVDRMLAESRAQLPGERALVECGIRAKGMGGGSARALPARRARTGYLGAGAVDVGRGVRAR